MNPSDTEDRVVGIGDNKPPIAALISAEEGDFAQVTTAFLAEEYAKQRTITQSLLDEATALMRGADGKLKKIDDDDTKAKVVSLIKRMRDHAKALTAFHSKEKQAYLRGGQGVDQFFFGDIDKLSRRDKKNKPGAADICNDELTDYDNRVLAAERARLQRIADENARLAREAEERRVAAEREAEEARLAAERARNPEKIEQKTQAAIEAEARADAAAVEVAVAAPKAEEARIDTLRKSTDIMRNRGTDGTLSTVGTEKYAEISDRTLLSKEMLWPYLKQDALESALTQWAKMTDYNAQMPGALIGRRNKSLVR